MPGPRALVRRSIEAGALPDVDYVLNHLINRIPWVDPRMWGYQALGVEFDARASSTIALGMHVWNGPGLSVGRGCAVGQRCYIDARGGVRLDAHASLAREVAILTATHIVDDPDFDAKIAPVHVGSRAFLGLRAVILPGVRIGEGAVVGANAVVTHDIAPYAVVAGNPARQISERTGPMRYELTWRPSWH